MKNFNCTAFLFVLVGFLTSCNHDPLAVDVSNIKVPEITVNRLEQDVFNLDTSNIKNATEKLQAKYGKFYSTFISRIINNGSLHDSSYATRMKQFIFDRDMREAYQTVEKTYPSVDFLKDDFTEIFKHYKYYFPEKNIPSVVTMISGFNYAIVPLDSTLAIGLDMYLGSDSKFYQMLALPRYKTMFMNKNNICPDAVRAWTMNEFPYNMDKSDFLSEIVYYGKLMYLTDALLPNVNDTIKIQYSSLQMEYCRQNEFNIWSYFAAQKLLYTTDQAEIMKYTADGPFTSALSKESAPRIGYWIGWQIVKQYMKNNVDISVAQLMMESDAQKILNQSKYKPGK